MENEIPLAPSAGWTIGPIKAYEAVTFKFNFLSHSMQSPDEAQDTPQFVMTAAQAAEFAEAIGRTIQQLKNAEFQAAPGPRH